ncbi:MAG: cupin [endosymbiont of Galathealinum brachiosum]|uniref:Cupin n=1 Tax=endosymbiont of Galathealinum brachiosum TaxID=2200906 RepID=A0A370DP40_9GAMM|nr:MAG: cupin [endosymbiont of Galathealinum brachiosum]
MKLNSDLTLRANLNINNLKWENSPSAGVQRLRLEADDEKPPVERVTTIVSFAPQSSFSGHVHGGGEEFLVLNGTFSDQHADYPEGYYVRNPKGTGHAPHSDEGCRILVKLWQMHPDDQNQLAINTRNENLWKKNRASGEILPLFNADYESVCMMRWPAGLKLSNLSFDAGVEYFVLHGRFYDDEGNYTKGSWLRLPAGSRQNITVTEDCLLLRKTGHLLEPVSYE